MLQWYRTTLQEHEYIRVNKHNSKNSNIFVNSNISYNQINSPRINDWEDHGIKQNKNSILTSQSNPKLTENK